MAYTISGDRSNTAVVYTLRDGSQGTAYMQFNADVSDATVTAYIENWLNVQQMQADIAAAQAELSILNSEVAP